MDLDEPIHLVAYDPHWTELAQAKIQRLLPVLGKELVACEHFGSASVPAGEGARLSTPPDDISMCPLLHRFNARSKAKLLEPC